MAKDNETIRDAYWVYVVVETDRAHFTRMWHWSIKLLKGCLEGSRYGPIIMRFYDKNLNPMGDTTITPKDGPKPSAAALQMAEEAVSEDEEEPHRDPPSPLLMSTKRR